MRRPQLSRRAFISGTAAALGGLGMAPLRAPQDDGATPVNDLRSIERRLALMGKRIRERYRDPRRHFIFE
jgi:hypothetical protein